MTPNDRQLWLLIKNQLPDYLRNDNAYSALVAFLQAYYTWLQQSGNAAEVISDTKFRIDIDTTIDEFVSFFTNEFIPDFPVIYDPNESNPDTKKHQRDLLSRVVKNADKIYTKKSVEDSYRTLFRILYDEEIQFFYPNTVILKPSDGRWSLPTSVKVTFVSGDFNSFDLTYGSAFAQESADGSLEFITGASATVESIIATETILGTVYELFLTTGTIVNPSRTYTQQTGNSAPFTPGNRVRLTLGSNVAIGTIVPVPSVITVNDTVGGHAVGDVLHPADGMVTVNTAIQMQVKSVDANGFIKAINVVDSGVNIANNQTVIVDASLNAVGSCTIGGVTYYPGRYTAIKGFLSDQIKLRGPLTSKFLPDGHIKDDYYQEFSYVIKSGISIKEWGSIVKSLLHPAGYQFFGNISIFPSASSNGRNLLGMFDFNQDDINQLDDVGAQLYYLLIILIYHVMVTTPRSIAEEVLNPQIFLSPTNILGPTGQTLNRFMMLFPPYSGGTTYYGDVLPASDVDLPGSLSVDAWDSREDGNTQIKDFANYLVAPFLADPRAVKTNITPPTYTIIA